MDSLILPFVSDDVEFRPAEDMPRLTVSVPMSTKKRRKLMMIINRLHSIIHTFTRTTGISRCWTTSWGGCCGWQLAVRRWVRWDRQLTVLLFKSKFRYVYSMINQMRIIVFFCGIRKNALIRTSAVAACCKTRSDWADWPTADWYWWMLGMAEWWCGPIERLVAEPMICWLCWLPACNALALFPRCPAGSPRRPVYIRLCIKPYRVWYGFYNCYQRKMCKSKKHNI